MAWIGIKGGACGTRRCGRPLDNDDDDDVDDVGLEKEGEEEEVGEAGTRGKGSAPWPLDVPLFSKVEDGKEEKDEGFEEMILAPAAAAAAAAAAPVPVRSDGLG